MIAFFAPARGGSRLVVVVAALVLAVLPAWALVSGGAASSALAPACGTGGELDRDASGNAVCIHADVAPPGIDVRQHVPTRKLQARQGAGRKAHTVAEDLGVPSTPTATTSPTASSSVPCDGDGTSGYRVQPMYVVESGQPNRFAALETSFQRWAAGANDVFNRSAALTGGVRDLRYVTVPGGDGSCLAKVLNVTVPAGSLVSFTSTTDALRRLGFNDITRKYLIWADATVLCGVANLYWSDDPAASNPNNGSFAQFARVDSGCWGLGDTSGTRSIEAHELSHTLGGVQSSAPHATGGGHCFDDSDTMCYNDGAGRSVEQVCGWEMEYLLDCNNDDYYSTAPSQGSYLDTHWNTADSRFLINGGQNATVDRLAGLVGVNSPATAGLPTQATVTPALVAGRTLRSVTWSSDQPRCSFSSPEALQTEVTCPADLVGSTILRATLVDSSGASATASQVLDLVRTGARPVALSVSVDRDASPSSVACRGAATDVTTSVVDQATGLPVMGVRVGLDRQQTGDVVSLDPVESDSTGRATTTDVLEAAATYTAGAPAVGAFLAGSSPTQDVAVEDCGPVRSTNLTGTVDRREVGYGSTVTVTGTATRVVDGISSPLAQVPVRVLLSAGTATERVLATTTTSDTGTLRASVPITESGDVVLVYPGSSTDPAGRQSLGTVTSGTWTTELGLSSRKKGRTYTVSGVLHRAYADVRGPLAARAVTIEFVSATGQVSDAARLTTSSTGAYSARLAPTSDGSYRAVYAGEAGHRASSSDPAPVAAQVRGR